MVLSGGTVACRADTLRGRREGRFSEPIAELVRPTYVDHERDGVPVLPAWAEGYFAEQRRYWAALREGGALTLDQEGAIIRAEVLRLSGGDDEDRR